MKQTIYSCDHCGLQVQESGIISSVEITFGGHGAVKDKIDGVDLCRGCYGKVVAGIRAGMSAQVSKQTA